MFLLSRLSLGERMIERRRLARYSLRAMAEVVDGESGLRLDAQATDLSPAGCYLATTNPLAVGRQVRVQLTHGDTSIKVRGTVAHSQTNMGMGIKFVDLDANSHATLQTWFAGLGAQGPS